MPRLNRGGAMTASIVKARVPKLSILVLPLNIQINFQHKDSYEYHKHPRQVR